MSLHLIIHDAIRATISQSTDHLKMIREINQNDTSYHQYREPTMKFPDLHSPQ